MDLKQCFQEWKNFDDARPSLPGEHLMTAGAGVLLILSALKSNNRLTAALQAMAGGALLFRSASGRDGLRKFCEEQPADETASDQVELGRS